MTATTMSAAPTEAAIRAYLEAYLADNDNWTLELDELRKSADPATAAFEAFIDTDHITDDDFYVFTDAHTQALRDLRADVAAALRPILVEAQVRGALAFFEHFPAAPLADREAARA